MDGFYAGDGEGGQEGDIFKIRFAPPSTGEWTYSVYSSISDVDGTSGKIKCVESDRKGPLVYDPSKPWYLHWADGTLFFDAGANDPEQFLASGYASQQQRYQSLDYLESAGVNSLYFGLVNDGPGDGGPESKVNPWLAQNGKHLYDNLCMDFMNRLEGVLDRMDSLGIVAQVVYYLDDCSEISDEISPAQEEMLFRYMCARFGTYSDLVWNLAEEYEEAFKADWLKSRAALLHKYDQLGHPVTVHQLTGDVFAMAGEKDFDFAALQFNFFAPDSINSCIIKVRNQVAETGRPIPVSLIEWNPIAPEQTEVTRKGIWAITTGGGTFQIFSKKDGNKELDFSPWATQWHYARTLRETVESLPLDSMVPDNELVSTGFCLAQPGECYLVYLPDGGEFSLNLAKNKKGYSAWLLDPRTGNRSSAGELGGESGEQKFVAPVGGQDWVYVVRAGKPENEAE